MLEHLLRTVRFAGAGLTLWTATLNAGVVMTYTGNHFDRFVGPGFGLDTSEFVVATITLAQALPANVTNFQNSAQVLDWSITDGLHTLHSGNNAAISNFVFSTNGSAAITAWVFGGVSTTNGIPDSLLQISTTSGSGNQAPFGQFTNGYDEVSHCCNDAAFAWDRQGSWAVTAVPAPEPGSLALMGAGIVLFGVMRLKVVKVGSRDSTD